MNVLIGELWLQSGMLSGCPIRNHESEPSTLHWPRPPCSLYFQSHGNSKLVSAQQTFLESLHCPRSFAGSFHISFPWVSISHLEARRLKFTEERGLVPGIEPIQSRAGETPGSGLQGQTLHSACQILSLLALPMTWAVSWERCLPPRTSLFSPVKWKPS